MELIQIMIIIHNFSLSMIALSSCGHPASLDSNLAASCAVSFSIGPCRLVMHSNSETETIVCATSR